MVGQASAQSTVKTLNSGTPGQVFRVEDFLQSRGRQMVVLVSPQSTACAGFREVLEPLAREAGFSVLYLNVDRPDHEDIDWRSPLAQQFQLHTLPYPILYDGRQKQLEGRAARKWLLGLRDQLEGGAKRGSTR